MPNTRDPEPAFRKLCWHGMMGVMLGVVFAGLLLKSGALQADGFVNAPLGALARLGIMLAAAAVFGLGAALTGALFLLVNEDR